jgi:hypothetical protein
MSFCSFIMNKQIKFFWEHVGRFGIISYLIKHQRHFFRHELQNLLKICLFPSLLMIEKIVWNVTCVQLKSSSNWLWALSLSLSNQVNLRCYCLLKNKVKANSMNSPIEHLSHFCCVRGVVFNILDVNQHTKDYLHIDKYVTVVFQINHFGNRRGGFSLFFGIALF